MTAPVRHTVTYGLDADAYLVAHAVNRALEGDGVRVMVDDGVWILRRNQPETQAVPFRPGQQLLVTFDAGWSIQDVPPAVTP